MSSLNVTRWLIRDKKKQHFEAAHPTLRSRGWQKEAAVPRSPPCASAVPFTPWLAPVLPHRKSEEEELKRTAGACRELASLSASENMKTSPCSADHNRTQRLRRESAGSWSVWRGHVSVTQ